jgi:hypothetical protein
MAGGESTTRGFLDGWDPETGKKLWRRHTIPSPGEPGSETWPKDNDAWMHGGAPTWRSGSYDPELDLVYWGTGNAEPYDPRPRGALDSLFASSVLAIRPKTGEVVCHFQYTPNDVYDVDGTDENVLADIRIDGQLRKVMIQANKNGFLYVLDRTNCRLIAAHPYVQVNWASRVDLATGRPVLTDLYSRFLAGEEVQIFPSRGTNAVPIAFNPNTGLIYASTWNVPRIQKLAPPAGKPQAIGASSTGVTSRNPTFKTGDVLGHFVAIDPLTGQKKWEVPLPDLPSAAGMLVTGGGQVFTGKLTGEFVALDERPARPVAVRRVEHQRHAIVYPQGPPVRDGRVWTRRLAGEPLHDRQGANRRIDLDVRAASGLGDVDEAEHHRPTLAADSLRAGAGRRDQIHWLCPAGCASAGPVAARRRRRLSRTGHGRAGDRRLYAEARPGNRHQRTTGARRDLAARHALVLALPCGRANHDAVRRNRAGPETRRAYSYAPQGRHRVCGPGRRTLARRGARRLGAFLPDVDRHGSDALDGRSRARRLLGERCRDQFEGDSPDRVRKPDVPQPTRAAHLRGAEAEAGDDDGRLLIRVGELQQSPRLGQGTADRPAACCCACNPSGP